MNEILKPTYLIGFWANKHELRVVNPNGIPDSRGIETEIHIWEGLSFDSADEAWSWIRTHCPELQP